jgi:hypothetical protein
VNHYRSSTLHRAAQFTTGMAAADAEALCTEHNKGRDPAKSDFCIYNGASIFVIRPPGVFTTSGMLTAEPGNWIVRMPDDSLEVHADADFCTRFCPASS